MKINSDRHIDWRADRSEMQLNGRGKLENTSAVNRYLCLDLTRRKNLTTSEWPFGKCFLRRQMPHAPQLPCPESFTLTPSRPTYLSPSPSAAFPFPTSNSNSICRHTPTPRVANLTPFYSAWLPFTWLTRPSVTFQLFNPKKRRGQGKKLRRKINLQH